MGMGLQEPVVTWEPFVRVSRVQKLMKFASSLGILLVCRVPNQGRMGKRIFANAKERRSKVGLRPTYVSDADCPALSPGDPGS